MKLGTIPYCHVFVSIGICQIGFGFPPAIFPLDALPQFALFYAQLNSIWIHRAAEDDANKQKMRCCGFVIGHE
jgi:hypothetical protein